MLRLLVLRIWGKEYFANPFHMLWALAFGEPNVSCLVSVLLPFFTVRGVNRFSLSSRRWIPFILFLRESLRGLALIESLTSRME